MKKTSKIIIGLAILLIYIFGMISFASALLVNADYVTLYPGEEGKVSLNIENNENFDIEDISASLVLDNLPFTAIGSSQKDIDDIDEDDDDSVTFTLKPSTDIKPGDYSIPYTIKYADAGNNTINLTKTGNFGIRVSAKTDLDFSAETRETAILGKEGQLSLNIVNLGLGEIKSITVQIFPQGFTLLSSDKVFVGTISADDSDTATFDVIYNSQSPVLSAKISYKDFDNNDQTKTVNLPVKVYTKEQALNLGLITKSNTGTYVLVILVLLVIWYIWRKIKKRRKQKLADRR
ncbi:MAG: hypothetical protein NTW17_02410 [Candidatus Pacearchaeota archaeon]|nr:hypothetical protein [Candidatus Pacearchaeota archaeon]